MIYPQLCHNGSHVFFDKNEISRDTNISGFNVPNPNSGRWTIYSKGFFVHSIFANDKIIVVLFVVS